MSFDKKIVIQNIESSQPRGRNVESFNKKIVIVPRLPLRPTLEGLSSSNISGSGMLRCTPEIKVSDETVSFSVGSNRATLGDTSENTKLWTDGTTKALISAYQKSDNEFSTGIKKYVWDKIARQLSEKFGQKFTSQQCDTKWKVLKNAYKNVKIHNERSGNSFKYWKYYDAMNEILFNKPEITPVATCSSAKGLVQKYPVTEENIEDDCITDVGHNSQQNFSSSFSKKRKNVESGVERRHREKMAKQDQFLNLLGRLTSAIENSTASGRE